MKLAYATVLAVVFLAAPAPPQQPAMRLTIYDDGLSCPGGCDAHVVFHPRHNGTAVASDPALPRREARACTAGRACRICFAAEDSSCMTALYRGGGPPFGTFDFTPAFYAQHCGRAGIPAALSSQCASLDAAVRSKGYDRRVNCVAEPSSPACTGVLAAARRARELDEPEYRRCLRMGERAYNRAQARPEGRRSNACAYSEMKLGGPNSAGVRWRKLLPAACRPDTFVGRDGLDCCSGDLRFAASTHPECSAFMPPRS